MTAARPSLQALQDLLSSDTAFAKSFGFRVTEADAGECRLVVPFNPLFERPGGIVSGQVFMAAADVAMWLAIKTLRGIDDDSVTISMQSSFLRSARREDVVCHARVMKAGGVLSHGTAECSSRSGEPFSHHTFVYMKPSPSTRGSGRE